jgi:hypothetical protein
MSCATPEMRNLAQQLVAYESRGSKSAEAKTAPALLVCEKLRPVLATLMGNGGFRGLLSRAVVLAALEAPWLKGAQVNAQGTLEGLESASTEIDPRQVTEGSVVLIAHALGLLSAFIGEDLTVRFVQEAWPKLHIDDFKLGSGGKK